MRSAWWVLVASCGCLGQATRDRYEGVIRAAAARAAVPRAEAPRGAVTRDALVRAAVSRDPGIAARALRVRALAESARAEGALPSPEANAQVWNVPFARPWSLGDADMYMVELRQRLPAWGSLDARARVTLAEAGAGLAELSARERAVARRVTDAWADYTAGALHHRVHHEHLGVVEVMHAAARARAVTGGGLEEFTRAELERARVLRQIARFDNDRRRASRALDALTLRAEATPLEPAVEGRGETVRAPLTELMGRALARRAMVAEARSRVEGARAGLDGARAEATRPEFMVGLSGWFDPSHHNGYGATVGMTLPWLWGPGGARVAAGEARLSAEEAGVREAEGAVRAEVIDAHARVEGIERELAVVRAEALPAADRALDAARAGYVTGAPLLAWLDAARMRLDLAMDEADLVVELARAVAALEEAVGEGLDRVALDDARSAP
jgi:outer membrane protein TolC